MLEIRVFAPCRVDLSAGYSDVEPFCNEAPAHIANVSLSAGAEIVVRAGVPDDRTSSFLARLILAVSNELQCSPFTADVRLHGVASGKGMGTSGAVGVGLVYGAALLVGQRLSPNDVAELACRAEWEAGVVGGTQDQLASAHGGAGLVTRFQNVSVRTSISADLESLDGQLTILTLPGERDSGTFTQRVFAASSLRKIATITREMSQVGQATAAALMAGDIQMLCACVQESRNLQEQLLPEIAPRDIHERLMRLGASAAKPCGAGGRGAAWLVLSPAADQANFRDRAILDGFEITRTHVASAGVRTVPYQGAQRAR